MAIESLINTFITNLPDRPRRWHASPTGSISPPAKVYEVYVFTVIARKFKQQGWALTHMKANGPGAGQSFIFRGAPGRLWGANHFSHLKVQSNKDPLKTFELHLGIEVWGYSNVSHEVDIGLLHHEAAEDARLTQSLLASALVLGTECKHYNIPLTKKIAREYLGVVYDLDTPFGPTWRGFASNQHDQQSTDLLDAHGVNVFTNLDSNRPDNVHRLGRSINELIDIL